MKRNSLSSKNHRKDAHYEKAERHQIIRKLEFSEAEAGFGKLLPSHSLVPIPRGATGGTERREARGESGEGGEGWEMGEEGRTLGPTIRFSSWLTVTISRGAVTTTRCARRGRNQFIERNISM